MCQNLKTNISKSVTDGIWGGIDVFVRIVIAHLLKKVPRLQLHFEKNCNNVPDKYLGDRQQYGAVLTFLFIKFLRIF